MKKAFFLLFGLISAFSMLGSAPATGAADAEQAYLELSFAYENYQGVCMDTMLNLPLYREVYEWLGTPYVYSGESHNGTDCSGFVGRIYQAVFGRKLAPSSCDMYKQDVTPLRKGELREGDLVFFKTRKKRVSHVGIYLGDNLFVHASTRHGVIISNLSEPYYSKTFYQGGRIKK